jgi:hypothetical protein
MHPNGSNLVTMFQALEIGWVKAAPLDLLHRLYVLLEHGRGLFDDLLLHRLNPLISLAPHLLSLPGLAILHALPPSPSILPRLLYPLPLLLLVILLQRMPPLQRLLPLLPP